MPGDAPPRPKQEPAPPSSSPSPPDILGLQSQGKDVPLDAAADGGGAMMTKALAGIKRLVDAAQHIVILTGAGISAGAFLLAGMPPPRAETKHPPVSELSTPSPSIAQQQQSPASPPFGARAGSGARTPPKNWRPRRRFGPTRGWCGNSTIIDDKSSRVRCCCSSMISDDPPKNSIPPQSPCQNYLVNFNTHNNSYATSTQSAGPTTGTSRWRPCSGDWRARARRYRSSRRTSTGCTRWV
jgi:hypothetical protein